MPRIGLTLDGVWDFWWDPKQTLTPQTLDDAGAPRAITVPGPWQAQFDDLRDATGMAWYRTIFSLDERFRSTDAPPISTYILHIGAADYYTRVYLNGQFVGAHEGGYLPFELTLDDALCLDGENELVVQVLDPGTDADSREFPFSEIPHGKQSWYGPVGGIWQSVSLEARHRTHFTHLHVTPHVEREEAEVRAVLNEPAPENLEIVFTITDPNGVINQYSGRISQGSAACEATIPIPQPLLWDTHSPYLYKMEVGLMGTRENWGATERGRKDGEAEGETPAPAALDTLATTFGMRTITTSPDGHLVLNGRVLYLRGALDQDYYPEGIYTAFSDAELDDQFAKAKHMGLNLLRTHIKVADPRYYDAADRAGVLIWTELPSWQTLTETTKARAQETLRGMVERDWNHPSIIIWTIINEGWGLDIAVNAEHRAWLRETYDYLKRLDPHRLVVGNSPCFSNFHVVTDIEDYHNYYSIPDHYPQWRDWVASFAGRSGWTFARPYQGLEQWRAYLRNPWTPQPQPYAPEVQRKGAEPLVVSEFGNWGLPDVAALKEGYGGQEPWWFETGQEWNDGVVYPHGVEQRFTKYHLDKVFPTLSDLARASQRMQYVALKYEIEQMRLHPSLVGYVITEFTDVHWECNGLLDMHRRPKAFYDELAQVNGADVVVPRCERSAVWAGERCDVRLALSHFGPTNLDGCRVEWRLEGWQGRGGIIGPLSPQHAALTDLGTLSFTAPNVKDSAHLRVALRLLDADGAEVTRNYQDLYVFPWEAAQAGRPLVCAPDAPELAARLAEMGYRVTDNVNGADVLVVETMTDEWREYVQRGGRIVWLAESPERRQTVMEHIGIQARAGSKWLGDWASNFNWLRRDHLFQRIPTDGLVDFAFADLTPDCVITGMAPRDFASDVHAGMFIGWLQHPAALVGEARMGHGRVLISTFRLGAHVGVHPVATVMLRDLIEYAAR